jgi:hypothetical protein
LLTRCPKKALEVAHAKLLKQHPNRVRLHLKTAGGQHKHSKDTRKLQICQLTAAGQLKMFYHNIITNTAKLAVGMTSSNPNRTPVVVSTPLTGEEGEGRVLRVRPQ